jgi:Ni/Fe-hydrogenase 1 B-type cytochrome subunit
MLERVDVWEAPVRILHWIHVASMGVLGFTGLYIAYPFIDADDIAGVYVMGWVRFIHFSAAFVLAAAFLLRFYWFFKGNRYEHWRTWVPIGKPRWQALWKMLRYYLFIDSERPNYIGVNPIAGLTYIGLGVLLVLQGITGFALFSLPFPSGFWAGTFGWLIILFGAQAVRLVHHVLLWLFVTFFIVHLYLAVLDDIEERSGGVVSIISGEKFEPVMEQKE